MSSDPSGPPLRRLALLDAVAFGDHAGPLRFCGDPASDLVGWAAGVAADVRLDGVGTAATARIRRAFAFGTARDVETPVPLTVVSRTAPTPISALEGAFASTCRDGLVLLDIERPLPPDERRIRRFFEASCAPGVVDGSEEGRLTLLGRRQHGDPMAAEPQDGALPVSIILFHDGSADRDAVAETLVDLLARPRFSVAELFVLDAAPRDRKVPKDLFGLRPTSTKVAIFPKARTSRARAIDDALGGVAMPMTAVVNTGSRFVPNAHALLGLALEKTSAPVVHGAVRGDDHAGESRLFRTDFLRERGSEALVAAVNGRAARMVGSGLPLVRPFPAAQGIIEGP